MVMERKPEASMSSAMSWPVHAVPITMPCLSFQEEAFLKDQSGGRCLYKVTWKISWVLRERDRGRVQNLDRLAFLGFDRRLL
jgi:hypothetical protein